jgi:hypothetical protein
MTHTFVDGVCTTCGEQLSYLLANRYGSQLGPKEPCIEGQQEFQLTVNVFEYAGILS